MSTKLGQIADKARSEPGLRFTWLARLMSEGFPRETWNGLNRKGAAGIDRETMGEYASGLDGHIRDLHRRLVDRRYRAPPVRAVEFPKCNGKVRVPGIPIVEYRLVQAAVARMLGAAFEPVCLDSSYEVGPGRSADPASQCLKGTP